MGSSFSAARHDLGVAGTGPTGKPCTTAAHAGRACLKVLRKLSQSLRQRPVMHPLVVVEGRSGGVVPSRNQVFDGRLQLIRLLRVNVQSTGTSALTECLPRIVAGVPSGRRLSQLLHKGLYFGQVLL